MTKEGHLYFKPVPHPQTVEPGVPREHPPHLPAGQPPPGGSSAAAPPSPPPSSKPGRRLLSVIGPDGRVEVNSTAFP